MIPDFDSRGLLPPVLGADEASAARSPYYCSTTELVERFSTSRERFAILRGFLAYRAMLYGHGYMSGLQMVDGSFVEQVEVHRGRPPADIDVLSWLDLPQAHQGAGILDAAALLIWHNEIVDSTQNKARYFVDSYGVLTSELDLPLTLDISNYWTSLFSHQRTTRAWKGFLAIPLDAAADTAALTRLDELEQANG